MQKELELIYEKITEGVKIRGKYQWYEESEKAKVFEKLLKSFSLILKKKQKRLVKVLVRKPEVDAKDISEISFKCRKGKSFENLSNILSSIDLRSLTNE